MARAKQDYRELHKKWMGYDLPPKQDRHYSISRITKLWKYVYNMDIRKIDGYKFNRHGRSLYNIYDANGKLVLEKVTLEGLYTGVETEYNNPDY